MAIEITGRGCCLATISVFGAIIGILQITLLVHKLNGGSMSWIWVLGPIWLSLLVVFGVPVLFYGVDKLIKFIKCKKHDKVQ